MQYIEFRGTYQECISKISTLREGQKNFHRLVYFYKITNKVNNLSYIGKTYQSIKDRLIQHIKSAYNVKSDRYHIPLSKDIRKYGSSAFMYEIIDFAIASIIHGGFYISEIERELITSQKTLYPNGYNLINSNEV